MSTTNSSLYALDPDHRSCVGGRTVVTCKGCAGNAPRTSVCQTCQGRGFTIHICPHCNPAGNAAAAAAGPSASSGDGGRQSSSTNNAPPSTNANANKATTL